MKNNELTRFISRHADEKLGLDISKGICSALMLYTKNKNDLAAALTTDGVYISTVGKTANKLIVIPLSMISRVYFEQDGDKAILVFRILNREYLYHVIDIDELKNFCRLFKKLTKDLAIERIEGGMETSLTDIDVLNLIQNDRSETEIQRKKHGKANKLTSLFQFKR
ncbi:hypothetical protein [[Clostridium] innocuum]|uniref:hypothetical protein n=1 Tax=Clostridium innocuum TaxID=1522 RepID=UPI000D6D3C49|nr:hypothetical protein [[Clostridium] innocuum]PWJ12845.1 hypothetical protein ATF84_11395 [[Clostridium] innocuum]SSA47237.1 hypothetical protein SAMN04487929_11395 [[Clostridium] innocuum]